MGISPQLQIATKWPASRIAIRAGKKILFIDTADITAVEAEGHYVLLQHKSSGYLLRESISTMAEKLSLFGFVRIHRSSLVNAAFVEEIQPLPTGEYMLRVRGGKKYIVTRTYKKNLHLLAESWIGTHGLVPIERGSLINSD
jgi:two-component system, LytTR family, response regulator